jgi:hypothetical protein
VGKVGIITERLSAVGGSILGCSTVAGLLLASTTAYAGLLWSFSSGYPSHDGGEARGTSSGSQLGTASFETAWRRRRVTKKIAVQFGAPRGSPGRAFIGDLAQMCGTRSLS